MILLLTGMVSLTNPLTSLPEPSGHRAPSVFLRVDKAQYPIFQTLDQIWSLYPQLRSDCSGFLKKVAQSLGVVMSTGDANAIVIWLQTAPGWLQLGKDPVKAATLAGQGYFVIAGKAEAPNGHVAVIVPGWSSSGAPMGYWGQLHRVGRANDSLTQAWIGDGMWNSTINGTERYPHKKLRHPGVVHRLHPINGTERYPHKKGTPAPLDDVLYFAITLPALKPVTSQ